MIRRYLKQRLGMVYKIIRPVTISQNSLMNRLKRQFAAANYIDLIYNGFRIINVDESSIQTTDSRKKGWWYSR